MLESFSVAFNAVFPFVIYLGVGYFAVRARLTDEAFMDKLNRFVFKLLFSVLMFKNVYTATVESIPTVKLIIASVVGILVLIALLLIAVPRVSKLNNRRGVIIQALFRGNFILYGIPLVTHVFGEERAAITGFMTLIVVSLFNIAAVIILESYNEQSKGIRIGRIFLNLAKNPLMQGCIAGLIFFALGIKLPKFLDIPVNALGNLVTPISMITLGGTLKFKAFGKNRNAILSVNALRLVMIPLIMLVAGYLIGLKDAELYMMLVIFGTPVAVASYPMAVNMGGDGELAGQIVFTTTVVSLFTIFAFTFALAHLGLIA
ncbi:MAG: AEC family transporter [Clostridiales bacterium]|nr:AEC family transporter [Clostridiales bacterium]